MCLRGVGIAAGAIFFVMGAYDGSSAWLARSAGRVAPGTVIENKISHGDTIKIYDVIRYRSPQGEELKIESLEPWGRTPHYKVGDTVEVVFPDENPRAAVLNTFWGAYTRPIFVAGSGALMIAMCVWGFE